MLHLFRDAKLVAEPAAAVATAGLLGPLRERLQGKRVGVLVCGSNIDPARFAELLARGAWLRDAGFDAPLPEMVQGSVQ
jgi:threonine dehydratase